MTDDDDIDKTIAAYRTQLVAEAELARGDLDEIEDHLRTLTDELRGTGMPAAAAVREAAHRLGDPAQLAREHARVRSPFGAKISRVRAWSAALLMAPMLVYYAIVVVGRTGVWSHSGLELGFGIVLVTSLVVRLAWVRPVLLGGMAFYMLPSILYAVTWPAHAAPAWLAVHLGVLAFLLPWRRGEVTAAGLALALHVWSFAAASLVLAHQVTMRDGSWTSLAPTAQVAFVASVIATCGGILRARWSAIAAAVSALGLVVAATELMGLRFAYANTDLYNIYLLGLVASGAVAAAASAVLAWRTARSNAGTFAAVLQR